MDIIYLIIAFVLGQISNHLLLGKTIKKLEMKSKGGGSKNNLKVKNVEEIECENLYIRYNDGKIYTNSYKGD